MSDAKKTSDELSKVAHYFHNLQGIGFHGDVPMYREYERICSDAITLVQEQGNTLNRLHSTMEDMVRGNASEEVSYLLRLMDKWEKGAKSNGN